MSIINKYNFAVYIHCNRMNDIPAKVAKYSFEKQNPGLNVHLEYLEDHPKLLENHNHYFYRDGVKMQWDTTKHQSFFPVRFLCAESHKAKKRTEKWILVTDPDIFCLKDLEKLNSYIKKAEEKKSNIIAHGSNSSVMLLNTEKVNWTEDELIRDVFKKKANFDNWMYLNFPKVLTLPGAYNQYDRITKNTALLHTTKTETQPWKTGITYEEWELHNKIRKPNNKKLKFKNHPSRLVRECVFSLFKEAYDNKIFSLDEIEEAIRDKALRCDIKLVCDL